MQSYCGIFSTATIYLFVSEINYAKIAVRNFPTTVWSGWVLHGSLLYSSLERGNFLNTDISQGSVVTHLRCGGIVSDNFAANLLVNLPVKEFWKSVNTWQSYDQDYSGFFFSPSVYTPDKISIICCLETYTDHFTAITQLNLCYTASPVKKWQIFLKQRFTAHMAMGSWIREKR